MLSHLGLPLEPTPGYAGFEPTKTTPLDGVSAAQEPSIKTLLLDCAILFAPPGLHAFLKPSFVLQDGLAKVANPGPRLRAIQHEPDDVLRLKMAYVSPEVLPFKAKRLALKKRVKRIVSGSATVGTGRVRYFPHLVEIGSEPAVPR